MMRVCFSTRGKVAATPLFSRPFQLSRKLDCPSRAREKTYVNLFAWDSNESVPRHSGASTRRGATRRKNWSRQTPPHFPNQSCSAMLRPEDLVIIYINVETTTNVDRSNPPFDCRVVVYEVDTAATGTKRPLPIQCTALRLGVVRYDTV